MQLKSVQCLLLVSWHATQPRSSGGQHKAVVAPILLSIAKRHIKRHGRGIKPSLAIYTVKPFRSD
jgi:hypothetical protein